MHLSEGVLHTPVLLGRSGCRISLRNDWPETPQFAATPADGIVCRCFFCCRYHSCTGWHWQRASHLKRHGRSISWLGGIPCLFNRIGITSLALFLRGICRA